MPKVKFDKKKNKDGKIYPWAYDEKNVEIVKAMDNYGSFMSAGASFVGKAEFILNKRNAIDAEIKDQDNEGHLDEEDEKKVFACENEGRFYQISPAGKASGMQTPYIKYVGPGVYKKASDFLKDCRKVGHEISAVYRNKYAGKKDAGSRYFNQMANRYADFIELLGEIHDPENGSMLKAEFDALALHTLNNDWIATPKIDTRYTFEQCIEGLDPIFEDYMTVLESGLRGTKVEYHRQHMEQSGWDEKKENIYLKELRDDYSKTVMAFDRLWNVDNRGQYDKFLDNTLDHMLGKTAGNNRDMNASMGMMRGYVRAIDMGYDSRHLFVLGIVGMQDQLLRKYESATRDDLENKEHTEAEKAGLRQYLESIRKYREDFDKFRDDLWNKRVHSKQEMEDADNRLNAFLDSHNTEEFKKIQYTSKTFFARRLGYAREEAADFEMPAKDTPRLTNDVLKSVEHFADVIDQIGAPDFFPGINEKRFELLQNIGTNTLEKRGPHKELYLNDDYDREYKDFADDAYKKLVEYQKNYVADKDHPRAETFKAACIEMAKISAEAIRAGKPLLKEEDGREISFWALGSLLPQLKAGFMKPEFADQLESGLEDFPLHKLAKNAIELQRMNMDYMYGQDIMTPQEKDERFYAMREKKAAMLELTRDLKEKVADPKDNVVALFGKKDLLTAKNQFAGSRGLAKLEKEYMKEFAVTYIPEGLKEGIQTSLAHFSGHAGITLRNKESEEHADIRRGMEDLLERLSVLEKGMTPGPDGRDRPFTYDEKMGFIFEAQQSAGEIGIMLDGYIEKGDTKDKLRLQGATEIKDFIEKLQDSLLKEQEFANRCMNKTLERENAKNNIENDNNPVRVEIKLDDLQKEENPEGIKNNNINEAVKPVNMVQNKESNKGSFKGNGLK